MNRSRLLVSLLFGGVLLGCGGPRVDESQNDGVIPAGAIPAAPDVRPGARPTSTAAPAPTGATADTAPAPATAPDTAR